MSKLRERAMDESKVVVTNDSLYVYPRLQVHLDLTRKDEIEYMEKLKARLGVRTMSRAVLYLIRTAMEGGVR